MPFRTGHLLEPTVDERLPDYTAAHGWLHTNSYLGAGIGPVLTSPACPSLPPSLLCTDDRSDQLPLLFPSSHLWLWQSCFEGRRNERRTCPSRSARAGECTGPVSLTTRGSPGQRWDVVMLPWVQCQPAAEPHLTSSHLISSHLSSARLSRLDSAHIYGIPD